MTRTNTTIYARFQPQLSNIVTNTIVPSENYRELNHVFDKYLFKIGNDYYKLLATGDAIKRKSICGDLINAYKLEWVLVD